MPQMLRLSDLMRLAMVPTQPEGPVQPYVPPPLSPFKQALGSGLESGVDVLLGALGLPGTPESKSRTFGELISAALPLMAATKGLKGALTAERAATAPRPSIKAYHGSPHDFDQFSLSKIGTGEGAQAYGHGLYFAESDAVARDYQKKLSQFGHASEMPEDMATSILLDNKVVSGSKPSNQLSAIERAALAKHYAGGNQQRAIKEMEDSLKYMTPGGEAYQGELATLEVLRNTDLTGRVQPFKGRMYEVNIHADPEDFLDWDAPLSQQHAQKAAKALGDVRPVKQSNGYYGVTRVGPDGSGKMIQGINESSPEAAMARWNTTFEGMSGANANTVLSGIAGDKAAVTEGLKAQGIPGIKYLDGASRSAGQGSRNYVVFDDKLISIVKKYGIAGALTAGLINESQARQMEAQGVGQARTLTLGSLLRR